MCFIPSHTSTNWLLCLPTQMPFFLANPNVAAMRLNLSWSCNCSRTRIPYCCLDHIHVHFIAFFYVRQFSQQQLFLPFREYFRIVSSNSVMFCSKFYWMCFILILSKVSLPEAQSLTNSFQTQRMYYRRQNYPVFWRFEFTESTLKYMWNFKRLNSCVVDGTRSMTANTQIHLLATKCFASHIYINSLMHTVHKSTKPSSSPIVKLIVFSYKCFSHTAFRCDCQVQTLINFAAIVVRWHNLRSQSRSKMYTRCLVSIRATLWDVFD